MVADGLFGFCGSERLDELFNSARSLPFPVPNKPMDSVDVGKEEEEEEHVISELRSCVKAEVVVLGSPSLM